MNEALQAKLATLGDTPLKEPKIYEAINSGDKVTLALNCLTEAEIKQYSAVEIGEFIHAVEERVAGMKDSEGVIKLTPNTEGCRLPNFIEADKLRKKMTEQNELMQKWTSATTQKEKDKFSREFGKLVEELTNLSLEISGLNTEALTDWEQALVVQQILETAKDAFISAMGKGLNA